MLELKQRPILQAAPTQGEFESKQPRRLLLALGILLIALVAVVIRDHEFWFGGDQSTIDADAASAEVAQPASVKTAPAVEAPKKIAAPAVKKAVAAVKGHLDIPPLESGVTATRTVLPPLDVEVVAGDAHRTVRPGSTVTNLEIKGAPSAFTATNAAERERIATVDGVYEASYPLLAQHMNVEGSVVLQALIGADGVIENLRVVSGPSILTAAAQQAVREWRFKPYVQNGTPVETKARITVNFSIKVADSSARS